MKVGSRVYTVLRHTCMFLNQCNATFHQMCQKGPAAKVIYPKYSKHCLSTVAHTFDVHIRISNHWLSFSILTKIQRKENLFAKKSTFFCKFSFRSLFCFIFARNQTITNGFGEHIFSNVYCDWDV